MRRLLLLPVIAGAACTVTTTETEVMPPGSGPEYTDQAGRLYAVVGTSGSQLVVFNVRDASVVGAVALGAVPSSVAVDVSGRVFLAQPDAVEVIDPGGGFTTEAFPAAAPRALSAWTDFNFESRVAVAGTSSVAVASSYSFDPLDVIALPPGGEPVAASFSEDGAILAIARGGASPDIVLVDADAPVVAVAYIVPLNSPDACAVGVDDVAFAQYGTVINEWHAFDLACRRLFEGGAMQSTGGTLSLGTASAPVQSARHRLRVDGWTDTTWVAAGDGVKQVSAGNAIQTFTIPGETSSIALANAGTIAWVASGTEIHQIDTTGASFTFADAGGVVHDLVYFDRKPRVIYPSDGVNASDCEGDGAVVTFQVFATDPDGDDTTIVLVPGEPGSLSGTSYTGTFSRGVSRVHFDVISGHFRVRASVAIDVDDCEPDPTPTPDPPNDAEDDSDGCNCDCTCAVAPARGTATGTAPLIAACAALILLRRRV